MFKYKLDTSAKKYACPQCEKKTFVRYINTESGSLQPSNYGRCDREINCGYHLNPYADDDSKEKFANIPTQPKQDPIMFPTEIMMKTLKGYKQNTFLQNLIPAVGADIIEKVTSLYYLGTITKGQREGAITFPFIDNKGRVRAVQVKQFDNDNHTTSTDFLHSIMERHYTSTGSNMPDWLPRYINQPLKVSCLFGEHLLKKFPHNPIALVEAPKTAIYGTAYFGLPDDPSRLLWLAVYNLSSLNVERCRVLAGRDVTLLPDLSIDGRAFEIWSGKAKQIRYEVSGKFYVSDLLERIASPNERAKGYDLADYLSMSPEGRLLELMRRKNPAIDRLVDFLGPEMEMSIIDDGNSDAYELIDFEQLFMSALDMRSKN